MTYTPSTAQGIDRSVPYQPFLVRQPVIDPTGTVVEVLELELGGSYGPMPADPPPFPRQPAGEAYPALFGRW